MLEGVLTDDDVEFDVAGDLFEVREVGDALASGDGQLDGGGIGVDSVDDSPGFGHGARLPAFGTAEIEDKTTPENARLQRENAEAIRRAKEKIYK